ncbi:MAG: hypothetical protein DRI61_09395, partial [Chloroflexi bacterium]
EVSLTQLRGDYKIKLRTFGIGEPGYKIGWFKLAGYPKALLYRKIYARFASHQVERTASLMLQA